MERLYLDHAATTPVATEVLAAMLPYLETRFGNPSSIHSFGRETREAVENARNLVAGALEAKPEEIFFTSGGTESDVLALRGAAPACRGKGNRIITCSVEHHAVLETCLALDTEGFDVTVLPVDEHGMVRLEDFQTAVGDKTILVSLMHANNEVGTIQPLREIAALAHRYGILAHTDAVQSFGKIPVSVKELGVDLLSISGHKIYGPKGIGALFIKEGTPFEPVFQGGGQEKRRRPGTENVPGIVGLGVAAALVSAGVEKEMERLSRLRHRLVEDLEERIAGIRFNGHPTLCLPGTVHFSVDGVAGNQLLEELDRQGIAVSCGAACTAGQAKPSYVLAAMGLEENLTVNSVRVSMGRGTTTQDVDRLTEALAATVPRLRI